MHASVSTERFLIVFAANTYSVLINSDTNVGGTV
jgi:hypothetical protein